MELFDNDRAKREGWEIWAFWPIEQDAYELRRSCHSRMFLSDDEAWTHVIQQAVFSESLYHLSALKFLEVNAPAEFERIESHAALLGLSDGVSYLFHRLNEMVST